MLKVLIVAATGSLAFEYIGADPEDYGHGKCFAPRGDRLLDFRGSPRRKGVVLRLRWGLLGRAFALVAEIKLIII